MKRSELIKLLEAFPAGPGSDPEVCIEMNPAQWATTPIIGIRSGGPASIVLTLRIPDDR